MHLIDWPGTSCWFQPVLLGTCCGALSRDMTECFFDLADGYKEELKPVFYTDGYNFFLTLWNLNYAYDKAQKSQMTDREYILLLLKENPSLTQVELSEMMDKSRRTVQMLMKELLDEGVIERIESKKKGSWLVK